MAATLQKEKEGLIGWRPSKQLEQPGVTPELARAAVRVLFSAVVRHFWGGCP